MIQLRFLLYLVEKSGQRQRSLVLSSLAAGLIQGLLLYSINQSVGELATNHSISLRTFLIFVLSLLALYRCLTLAMGISAAVGRELVTNLELRVTENLSEISYPGFVSLNQPKIFEAISGSKDIVNEASILLPIFISSLTMLACSLMFAAYISIVGLIALLVVVGLAAIVFFYSDQRFVAALFNYRLDVEKYQQSLKSVVNGFTELKMNESRRVDLFQKEINKLRNEVLKGRRRTDGFRVKNTVMYGILVYFPVAALLFALPQTNLATFEECIKIIAITMFSTIPLIGLLSFMPMAARAAMIVWSLADFEKQLASLKDEGNGPQRKANDFNVISIKGGHFAYRGSSHGSGFELNIEDFQLNRGELVILKGGNGSGKSTFMRLLAGLTILDSGRLTVDGIGLETIGQHNYRAFFSVLFPDFHLFKGLYGLEGTVEECREELKRMGLEAVVEVSDAGLFSTLSLSSGQSKRLALVCALMEHRPVLLFDEVAADFDHHFRELFYRTFLPALKAAGRTMLVISHDEHYSDIADRVLTLEYGRFV
jgi:putative ATP-binding cassette transporter